MILPLDIFGVLAERWPDLTICIILAGAIGVAVWRLSKLYYTEIKFVKDKVEHADCSNNKVLIGEFDKTTKQILRKIDFIEKAIIANNPQMLNAFSETHSPRQMNDTGRRLFDLSGANKLLKEHQVELVGRIETFAPSTAYDVEQYAYQVLIDATSESWFDPLKEFVYNSPVFDGNNINIGAICFVMSMELRNRYFEIHSEIDTDDTDAVTSN